VELTGAERAVAWLSLLLAAGVMLISMDMLTGGRLLGWTGGVWEEAVTADDSGSGD
jgi:hypothetical protein